jgi:formamidopyrimidine-DNA glycosylase
MSPRHGHAGSMPEFVEAEAFRLTARPLVGEAIEHVEVRDDRILRLGEEGPSFVVGALAGSEVLAARRIGKVVLLDLSSGHTVALAFGLRGWVSLDGRTARVPDGWRARSHREAHVRMVIVAGGRRLVLEDQLRMSTLRIDLDESALGIDVIDLRRSELAELCARSVSPVKSLLMDQSRIAGIGNLIADEILFQAKLDPRRPAGDLDAHELGALWTALSRTRRRVLQRGGSHHGVIIGSGARRRDGDCPRCGVSMCRVAVGGRTTFFCPQHQR